MKRLATILFIYGLFISPLFSQLPEPDPLAETSILNLQPDYLVGCETIIFKWTISDGILPINTVHPIDAEITFFNEFYELVSIQWDNSPGNGIPNVEIIDENVINQGNLRHISIDNYNVGLPAEAIVIFRPIRIANDNRRAIASRSKFHYELNWRSSDLQIWNITVGGFILTGNVSQLIEDNILDNASYACSTSVPMNYFVETDLIVDEDYCFKAQLGTNNKSVIKIAPGANIIVNEGVKLTLDRVLVTSCGGTWGSIVLSEGASLQVNRSIISEASLAIHQLPGSNVTIIDSDIEACQSGIRSEGGSTLFLKNSTITNTTTTGRGRIAVELADHKFASFEESHVEHFEEGIRAWNPNIQYDRSSVHDMEAGSYGDGTGVYLVGSGYGDLSTITGDRNNASGRVNFKDCDTGVKIIRQGVLVESNLMEALDVGIEMNNTFNNGQEFLDNLIEARDYGIILSQNSGSRGEIADNEIRIISGGDASQASCIRMDNTTGAGWKVSQNSFYADQGTYGIRSSTNRVLSISDNAFFIPNTRPAYGLFADNEFLLRVQCNTAESTLSTQSTTGYSLNGVTQYYATCNSTDGVQNGFYFNGQNTGMNNLRGNDLGGVYGLTVGFEGSRCDMQFNRGNCFNNTDAQLKDNTFDAGINSRIKYNYIEQNGGVPCFKPQNIFGPSNWFTLETNPEYSCSTSEVACDAPTTNLSGDVCDSESYIHTIDSPRVWTYNQEAQQMYAELAIYHTLRLADCPSPASTLDSLLSAHQGDVWDAYVNYEEVIINTSDAQLTNDSIILSNQFDRLLWYDSLGILFSDTSYFDSSAVQSVLGEISQCDSVIQIQELIIAADRSNNIDMMDSILNVPTPSNLHETRLLNVMKIHLDVLKEDSTLIELSTADSMYLDSIAHVCIYESGKAGAIARTVLSYFSPSEQYDDDSLCVPVQYRVRHNTGNTTEQQTTLEQQLGNVLNHVRVSPNPTSDEWRIELLNGDKGLIRIFDITGRVVNKMKVHGPSVNVPTMGLPSGMYLLQWTGSEGGIETHKLYVQ